MKIFIPIKEISQRVPGKNFRDFGGNPLWLHAVNKFRELGEVFIDTDSDKLLEEANRIDNVMAYSRVPTLRGHDVSVNRLIKHWLDSFINDENETLVQLHVTNPFLKAETIDRFQEAFEECKIDTYCGANIIQARGWRLEATGDGCLRSIPLNHNPNVLEETQSLQEIIVENSTFYMFTKRSFNKLSNRMGANPHFGKVEFPENIDIDTEEDWKLAIKLLKD